MSLENKLNKKYGAKTLALKVEDVDLQGRKAKFYLSAFDVKDSDNDIIRAGTFTKSIQERGVDSSGNRRIAHLRNHNWDNQIGKFTELYEDSKGLVGVSELGRSTKGEDALRDYQDGIIREHSIGFNYIKGKIEKQTNDTYGEFFNITEVKLWEGSAVTFGANELTPVLDVAKGLDYNAILTKIQTLSESLNTAIKNGKGTDERLENIELMFAQLMQLQDSLKGLKPSIKDTLNGEPTNEEARKQILIKLIKNDRI